MIKYTFFYLPYSLIIVLVSLFQHVYSNPLNTPTIDLTSLQQMGLAGNYGGISIIKDDKQLTQIPVNTSSIIRYGNNQPNTKEDNNIFELLASTSVDGTIYCSCQFNNGDIYFGGKFSSINNVPIYNIAKYNLQQQQITSLANGLDGPVYSLHCDPTSNNVYVGGDFIAPKQSPPQYTAAMAYYGGHLAFWSSLSQSWSPFPFKGVNGPVYSIEKVNNMLYFAGQFDMTADSQSHHAPASQPVNLQSPTTFATSGADENYNDPTEVVCSDGDSHPWLLQDNTRGYWQASFPYAIHVSLIRIANTHYNGRGTYEFGIFNVQQQSYFNLSYIDPKSGSLVNCNLNCTLSDDPTISYQDFLVVGETNITSNVRIDIMSWYGLGGGLASVEIFQSEIFVHADSSVGNFPSCSASEKTFISPETTKVGKWTQASAQYSHYLTSTFPATNLKSATNSITFTPYLPETGNYTVIMHTPGCKNNDNCNQRTKVDLSIHFAPNTSPVTFTIDQATDDDRFDTIYKGFIQSTNTSDFRPYVTLTVSKQAKTPTKGNVLLVANYVQFIKSASLNGLSSLLTYTPPTANNATSMMSFYNNGTTNLPWKALLTDRLPYNSLVKTMVLDNNNNLYIGGQFKYGGNPLTNLSAYENLVQLDTKKNQLVSLPRGGLNGLISTLAFTNNDLYIGGQFTDFTMPMPKNQYISHNFIKYNIPRKEWGVLAGGVNGPVSSILLTSKNSLLVSGTYTGLYTSGNPNSVSNWTMSGNCWWDINGNKWIPSLEQPFITGIVYDAFYPATSSSSGKGNNTVVSNWVYYMGSISSAQRYASNGFVYLNNQTKPLIALSSPTIGGSSRMMVTAGAFWNDPTHNNASSIILGGLIQLPSDDKNNNNNLQNIVLYQNGQWKSILPSNNSPLEMINDMMVVSNRLFIGGQFFVKQKLNAFAIYDLVNQTFVPIPDLHTSDGSPTSVNAIKYSDTDNAIIVGGNFSAGGSLSCYGVCSLDTTEYQWNNLGDGVMGNVTDFVFIDNKLMVAGTNLSLTSNGGSKAPAVSYDFGLNSWDIISSSDNMDNGLPGPCNTVSYDNVTRTTFFAGIQSNTSSAYLRMWNGQQFSLPNQDLGLGSYIEQLSVIPIMTNASLTSLPLTTSNLAGNNQSVLLATGLIILPNGNVSAALYNGTHWIPYLVASSMNGSPGLFKNVFFKSYNMSVHNTRYLPFPIVVLISIASALGIVFVLVLGSLFVLFIKRRQEAKVGDVSAMNNNNPATYYGKPPHRPESLLAMLNSPNAGTGLYALKKEMMEDRSINNNDISSSPTAFSNDYNNNANNNNHEFMTGAAAAGGVGAIAAGGTMMEMKNISSNQHQPLQRPPDAHVNHPNAAFIGATATTTTTLNDLNTHANSRNITSPTSNNNNNNNNISKNARSSSHDSYNPFRQSYSSSLNLNMNDQSPITPSQQQQNEWHSNYNVGSAITTNTNGGIQQNGGSYMLGGATAINNGSTTATGGITTATSNGISGMVTTGNVAAVTGTAAIAAVAAVPFMNQQQQMNNQQHQNNDNEIMKGGVRWTTAGMNDASFATVGPTATTTDSVIMNQQNHHHDDSVNRPLNIPSMHLGHIGNLTPDVAQWTTTTAPTSSSYMQESSTTAPTSLQPQTVEMRNLNATSAVAATMMASSFASEKDRQNKNNQSSTTVTNGGASGEAVRWTQVENPESHALAKAIITKPTTSAIISENNNPYDTKNLSSSPTNMNISSSIHNNNDSTIYSSSPKEYAHQQQGQPIQWTNYSTSDVKDTLQIKNVTTSMYSDYSSFPSYSNQDITLPGISSDFASDPDFAKWTTAGSDDADDRSKEKDIQQQQPFKNNNNNINNGNNINKNNDINDYNNNNNNNNNNNYSSSSTPSSSSAVPASLSHSNIQPSLSSSSQQTSTLPSSPSSTSISSKSTRQPTYTSNLRYSSVILPDDMVPIAPSPRSSISSTVSNYQDHSINNQDAVKQQQQQVNKLNDVQVDKEFSFRWSDIVDSEMNDDDLSSSQQHPLTATISTDNESSTTTTNPNQQQGKDSKWAASTNNALLSTGMEQTKSNTSNSNKNPLDGRAASKKMVQDYFSSRENSGTTTSSATKSTMDENKRAKYKSDFRLAMKQAFGNNSNNGNDGCSEDKPYLYIAKFDFSAREHGELGFEKGDPIIVIDAEDDIWWMGFKDSKDGDEGPQQGVFPSNYVERATTLPY
ncbi:unnamed protein product [Cunninghamella blakesleeana]